MAFEGPQPFKFSMEVASAVSKFRFLTLAAGGRVAHATAHGDVPVGVSQDGGATAAGKAVSIAGFPCVTKIESGAAFPAGANLAPDSQGRAVVATSGQRVWAVALEAATGAGQYVTVLAQYPGRSV